MDCPIVAISPVWTVQWWQSHQCSLWEIIWCEFWPSEAKSCDLFCKMCIKWEVQKWQMWGFVYESLLETALLMRKERFVFPFKCACNIMDYIRLDIWSINHMLQKIQTGLFNIWTIWTSWYVLNFCQVRQWEFFFPSMCMKCEVIYRKPHIVCKTHNESSNGSTVSSVWTFQWYQSHLCGLSNSGNLTCVDCPIVCRDIVEAICPKNWTIWIKIAPPTGQIKYWTPPLKH